MATTPTGGGSGSSVETTPTSNSDSWYLGLVAPSGGHADPEAMASNPAASAVLEQIGPHYGLLEGMRIPNGPLVNALRAGTFSSMAQQQQQQQPQHQSQQQQQQQQQQPATTAPAAQNAPPSQAAQAQHGLVLQQGGHGGGGAAPPAQSMAAPGGGADGHGQQTTPPPSSSSGLEPSAGGNIVDRSEMIALTNDIKLVKDAFQALRAVFQKHKESEQPETLRVACHERLAEALTIIQNMMIRYPLLQCPPVIQGAAILIEMVRAPVNEADFYTALDGLAMTFSTRVSGYLTGEITTDVISYETLTPEQIDLLLMRHDQGVDHALNAARSWTKYAEDVLRYVDKRNQLELEFSKKLAKMCQATRVTLKEESYLPFQSVYCTALDNDLELCANTQTICAKLQSKAFVEPLTAKANAMKKNIKTLDSQWVKALKSMQDRVGNLNRATTNYQEKKEDHERCREAVRIAEQGAEIGATAENKVDKRKRNEEEAKVKIEDAERSLNTCLQQANEHHARLMQIKSGILRTIREMILDCDQTMKAVTVNYFKCQLDLMSNFPVQLQTLLESSRRYEAGSQYMEFVRCRIGDQCSTLSYINPFGYDHQTALQHALQYEELYGEQAVRGSSAAAGPRKSTASMDSSDFAQGTYKMTGDRSFSSSTVASVSTSSSVATSSTVVQSPIAGSSGIVDPTCDTDSFDSKDEADRSKDTSPSASPRTVTQRLPAQLSTATSEETSDILDHASSGGGSAPSRSSTSTKVYQSLAASTHRFKKIKTPSRCRECDNFICLDIYACQDCGFASHKKCLELLLINCGHKRMPRKVAAFSVDLVTHLMEAGCTVPPVVCRCIFEIEKRGMEVKGIYRVSGAAKKVDRLCHAMDVAVDLVELADVSPQIVANILKKYMQKLPEPLIVYALYYDFIRLAKSCPGLTETSSSSGSAAAVGMPPPPPPPMASVTGHDDEVVIVEYKELVRKLPRQHYSTLALLMHHLLRVSKVSDVNNMPASNLAIVFGPTIFRHPENKDNHNPSSLASLMDTEHQTRCIELLIVYAEEIFGPYDSVVPREYLKYNSPPHSHRPGSLSVKESLGARPRGHAGFSNDNSVERYSVDHHDAFAIPGLTEHDEDQYDSDGNAEAIPPFLQLGGESKLKKSPLLNRGGSDYPIIKQSLKNFTGLTGLKEGLSTQDSLETSQKLSKQPSSEVMVPVTSRKSVPHDSSTSASVRHHRASDALFAKMGKAAKKHSLDEDYLSPPPSATGTGHAPLSERLSSDMAQLSIRNPLQHSASASAATMSDSAPASASSIATSLSSSSQAKSEASTTSTKVSAADSETEMTTTASTDQQSSVLRSSTSPATGRTSLTIGIPGAATSSGRSSQMSSSEEQQSASSNNSVAISSVAEQRRKFLASSSATMSADSHHFPPVSSSSAASSASHYSSGNVTSTIANLDENRVKIQVHGSMSTSGASSGSHHHHQHHHQQQQSSSRIITKQKSIDRG